MGQGLNTTGEQRLRAFYHAAFGESAPRICVEAGLHPSSPEQIEAENAAVRRVLDAADPDHMAAVAGYCHAFAEAYVHLLHDNMFESKEEHDSEVLSVAALIASFYRGLLSVSSLEQRNASFTPEVE